MPWTKAGREALEAIYRENADFARQYDGVPYSKIPLAERDKQRARDKEMYSLQEQQAIADSPEAGRLFQLYHAQFNDTERDEYNRLYWAVYALGQRTEDSQREAA